MSKNYDLANAIKRYERQLLTQPILADLLKEYKWPHNKVVDLEGKGFLVRLKKGLYITGTQKKQSPDAGQNTERTMIKEWL